MSKKYDYNDDEVETISKMAHELGLIINKYFMEQLKPDGTDKLSRMCGKYDDNLITNEVLFLAAGCSAGLLITNVMQEKNMNKTEMEYELAMAALRGITDGINVSYELNGISNVIDLFKYFKK